jgi:hypothetical protein
MANIIFTARGHHKQYGTFVGTFSWVIEKESLLKNKAMLLILRLLFKILPIKARQSLHFPK